ncbi:MAG: hypothetical protein R2695_05205 [Acidimicrobiales bacterium]
MTRPTRVFVRDDDLGKPFAALPRFHRMFVDRGIPIAYQVVPSFLDGDTAAEARAMHDAHPDLVELHQHGNRHEQMLDDAHAWSEFAGSAPYADQLTTLGEGRERLTALLGPAFDPSVFTPPAHKYGPTTVRALEALGVRIISCGVHTDRLARAVYATARLTRRVRYGNRTLSHHGRRLPGSRITEWSCAIDVDQDGNGNRVTRSADELRRAFGDARRHLDVVGLMLHHECYDDDRKFAALEAFLDELAGDQSVRFVALGSLEDGS